MNNKKQSVRQNILAIRRSLDANAVKEAEEQILRMIEQSDFYQRADTILCYVDYNKELPTRRLIEKSLELGKRVGVPKVLGPGKMNFYQIKSLQELKKGYFGIEEPDEINSNILCSGLVFVPGTAFDKKGFRMGYGAGFYDQWLVNFRQRCLVCGLAYSFQVINEIPVEAHDQKMDILITPDGISDMR